MTFYQKKTFRNTGTTRCAHNTSFFFPYCIIRSVFHFRIDALLDRRRVLSFRQRGARIKKNTRLSSCMCLHTSLILHVVVAEPYAQLRGRSNARVAVSCANDDRRTLGSSFPSASYRRNPCLVLFKLPRRLLASQLTRMETFAL